MEKVTKVAGDIWRELTQEKKEKYFKMARMETSMKAKKVYEK